jgi:hypothetical protein
MRTISHFINGQSVTRRTLSSRDPILTAEANAGTAAAFLGNTPDNSYTSPITCSLTSLPASAALLAKVVESDRRISSVPT